MIEVHTEAVIKTNIEEVANINRFSELQKLESIYN